MIATPAVAAQDVADRMVACGITSILNFAPIVLAVPEQVDVRKVDLSIELQILAYHEQRKAHGGGDERMSVLVVGISHKSAPVSLLERVALDGDGVHKLIDDVAACEHVTEATVIATCNRLEIYADVDRFHGSVEEVSRLLVERAGEATEAMLPHLYVHYDDGAVSHLFQVVAGLDSMALGEGQILGQTRDALSAGPGDRHRRPRPQRALPAGAARRQAGPRRDRHRPGRAVAGLAPRSTAATRAVGDLTGKRALVLGAGAMAGLATATLSRRGAASVTVANRTAGNADRLADEYGARSAPARPTSRPSSRSPTSSSPAPASTGVIVTAAMVAAATADGRELAIIDLALPHDVEPEAGDAARRHADQPRRARRRAARLRGRPRGRGGARGS